jgi:hypothetical protein
LQLRTERCNARRLLDATASSICSNWAPSRHQNGPRGWTSAAFVTQLRTFKTLYSVSVLNTCHFLKSSKSLHVSAWIGHPQVLIIVL